MTMCSKSKKMCIDLIELNAYIACFKTAAILDVDVMCSQT